MLMMLQYAQPLSQQMLQQMSMLPQYAWLPSQLPQMPLQQMSQLPLMPSQLPPRLSWEEQQPWTWVVQQVHEAWQVQLSVEQARQECLSAEHAWQVLLSAQPVQPAQLLAQQLPVQQPLAKKAQPCCPAQPKADCEYIDDLPQATLHSMAGRCVLIDPGQHDLLFAMYKDSSVEKKCLYQYTCNQQDKEMQLTKFKQLWEKFKKADTEDITALECTLGAGSCIKPDLKLFKEYLEAQALVADQLTIFYNKMYTVHLTSTH
ncbi:hypothetical protein GGH96_003569 [Coemansia sp. RSA 1972]|nr:hypothetical protein GGH96_003569 [Coemansia sp. RSA 1972]